jgi:hypothetical protein
LFDSGVGDLTPVVPEIGGMQESRQARCFVLFFCSGSLFASGFPVKRSQEEAPLSDGFFRVSEGGAVISRRFCRESFVTGPF